MAIVDLRDATILAYGAQQQAEVQLAGTVGTPWESATAAVQEAALARAYYIQQTLAASGAVQGTFQTTVGTAGFTAETTPTVAPAVVQGAQSLTLHAATLTGTCMPGDLVTVTGVWDLVTVGGITTSGSANLIGNSSILITAATSLAGQIRAGQTFTISAQVYSCTATTQAGAAGGFAVNTIAIPVTPAIVGTISSGTTVTVGNWAFTIDAPVVASGNNAVVAIRSVGQGIGGAPTIPTGTVWAYTTPIGIKPAQAQFIFDQVILDSLPGHGGN